MEKRAIDIEGTVRRIGLEGGVFALVTDEGTSYELLDPPAELMRDGVRAKVRLDVRGADVSIGMIGQAGRVVRFELL